MCKQKGKASRSMPPLVRKIRGLVSQDGPAQPRAAAAVVAAAAAAALLQTARLLPLSGLQFRDRTCRRAGL